MDATLLTAAAPPPRAEPPITDGLQVVSIAKSYDKRVVLTDVSVSVISTSCSHGLGYRNPSIGAIGRSHA